MRCSLLLLVTLATACMGFVVPRHCRQYQTLLSMAEVEVCGFKDCKRAGGGARLEKLITEILEEKGVDMEVNKCDCQVSLFQKTINIYAGSKKLILFL